MKKVFFACIIVFLNISFSSAQNIDSLLHLIEKDKEDTTKAIHLDQLNREYEEIGDFENGLKYGKASLDLSRKLNFRPGIADAHNNLGNIFSGQGEFPTAIDHYLKALKQYEELKDLEGVASAYGNIGSIYHSEADFLKALDYYQKAFAIAEKLGDKNRAAIQLGNLGIVYSDIPDYQKALDHLERALKLSEELKNKNMTGIWLGNIGTIYADQGDYPKALDYFLRALKMREEVGNKFGIAKNLANIGSLYTYTGQFNEAEKYLKRSIEVNKEIGALDGLWRSEESLSLLYDTIAKVQASRGNFAGATENYRLSIHHYKNSIYINDTLFNQERDKDITRKEMNFAFEKKEAATKAEHDKQIAVAEADKKRQQLVIWSGAVGLLLVALILVIVIRSLRVAKTQKALIEEQKEIVEYQRKIVEEKHKEITDSINYAERIQRSFLATEEILDANLKDYFVFFRPKDIVSGDFYWAGRLNNGNFALAVADSTGHGVPGAIMSILNISSLEKSIEKETEPNKILNETRRIVIDRLKNDGSAEGGKDGMDCSLLVMDPHKTQLSFAAAHNPVLIVRNKELIEFKADKMSVGKHDKDSESFTLQSTPLYKGDVIYTLTDGFPDQFGGSKGKKFMFKNLKSLFLEISELPMKEQEQRLTKEFDEWKGVFEQVDDICIVGFRI
ncbi:MAG TPA: tetratricopeptide repeat protein [Bacteroidia bacterium]|jgi:serine phosphatase RsbU (regulator of sigma subunit)/Tfp pilus assembly protein PilF